MYLVDQSTKTNLVFRTIPWRHNYGWRHRNIRHKYKSSQKINVLIVAMADTTDFYLVEEGIKRNRDSIR